MCIGLPLCVTAAWPGGALVAGRRQAETIDTRLVGDVAVGDWLLVFQGAARERLDAARAAEINATLDLLEAAMAGDAHGAGGDAGFSLPSRMDAATLAALTGSDTRGHTA